MSGLGKDIFDEAYAEGYAEGVKLVSIKVAKAMIQKDYASEEIMKISRLSLKEIQKLKEELSKESNP